MRQPTTLAAAVLAVLAFAATPVAATSKRDTSAGGACHAANGAAQGKLTYGNNQVTNAGTTDQYVICHFQMHDDSTQPQTRPSYLQVSVAAGPTTATVSCVFQEGAFTQGTNHIISSKAQSFALGAGQDTFLNWGSNPLARSVPDHVLTLNCKLPAGFKLGLIEYWEG